MVQRDALLALPGPSTTSLVLNIPYLSQSQNSPVVLIDIYDYNKIRSRAILEESTKYHYLTLAYEELARRGIIDLIDYSEFYPRRLRERNLERNTTLLENLSEDLSRRYATVACELWTDYARGEYQEDFRAGLSEDLDDFLSMRRSERKQKQKISAGTGDSEGWLRKVINKDVAALHIRRNAQRQLDHYNVKGVVAGGEHLVTGHLDGATSPKLADFNLPKTESNPETAYLDQLEAGTRIHGLMPADLTRTRTTLGLTSDLAREVAGITEDDWFVLGPSLALPSYDDLFDMKVVQEQFEERSLEDLQQQATAIIDKLQASSAPLASTSKLQYLGEYTAEQQQAKTPGFTSSSLDGFSVSSLTASIEHAVQLSMTSNEIRSLTREGGYDQAAVFVALSFLSDPARRYEQQDVYRKATEIKRRLSPPSIDESELKSYQKERQGKTWADNRDWHENPKAR